MKTTIIGVDPAPGKKGSTLFDGKKFHPPLSPLELKKTLLKIAGENSKVLICWDSPLTGPSSRESDSSPFYLRPIERELQNMFRNLKKHNSNASGVSVLGYAGCSHWTVSRHVLGLPIVGDYDSKILPFQLVTSNDLKAEVKKSVIEVHPALAIYYWQNKKLQRYKGNKPQISVTELWQSLKEKNWFASISEIKNITPEDDNELDALVAYALGYHWLNGSKDIDVRILGNDNDGAILLPFDEELFDSYGLRQPTKIQ